MDKNLWEKSKKQTNCTLFLEHCTASKWDYMLPSSNNEITITIDIHGLQTSRYCMDRK